MFSYFRTSNETAMTREILPIVCLVIFYSMTSRSSEASNVSYDMLLTVITNSSYLSQPLFDMISACAQQFKHVRYEPTFGQILFTTYARLEGSIITPSRFSMTSQ